ncbi:S4 domain-containing protein YaaA [Alicyclobacillus curvatus]|nr:S4 domain-containing protein YaaA [Alicyclobacillus curvatus]
MEIQLEKDFIQLGQVLKLTDYISSGGEAKIFLQNTKVYVNSEQETKRGRKLYAGDVVEISGKKYTIVGK